MNPVLHLSFFLLFMAVPPVFHSGLVNTVSSGKRLQIADSCLGTSPEQAVPSPCSPVLCHACWDRTLAGQESSYVVQASISLHFVPLCLPQLWRLSSTLKQSWWWLFLLSLQHGNPHCYTWLTWASAQAGTLRCLPASFWDNIYQGRKGLAAKPPCSVWGSLSLSADICGVILENKGSRNFPLVSITSHLIKLFCLLRNGSFFSHPIAIPELHDSQNTLCFSWNLTSISSTLYIFVLTLLLKSLSSCPVLSSLDVFTDSSHILALCCWAEPDQHF